MGQFKHYVGAFVEGLLEGARSGPNMRYIFIGAALIPAFEFHFRLDHGDPTAILVWKEVTVIWCLGLIAIILAWNTKGE